VAFAWVFYEAGAMKEVMIAIGLAGSVLGFWFFNFGNAKIFMGDNGSTFIGIVLTYLTITYFESTLQAGFKGTISPFIAGAILLIPLADMMKVVLGRVFRGVSPFRGDHTHIHHTLNKIGASHRTICLILYGWNALVIIFSLILLPQDFYLANTSLLFIAGLPYLGISLSERILKDSKTNSFETSGTREIL
jgi:UDP-GlcNAc:undecaprenyl-phosphate/decaprenyl-phosphate GlcNAc-1-phosphate transferase